MKTKPETGAIPEGRFSFGPAQLPRLAERMIKMKNQGGRNMKTTRRILAVLLAAVMLACMVSGCSNSQKPADQGQTPSGAQSSSGGQTSSGTQPSSEGLEKREIGDISGKTISLISSQRNYDGLEDAWKAAADGFKEETGATVTLQFQGEFVDLIQTLQAAKMSGEKYDMSSIGSGNLHQSVAKSGIVMDITEIVEPLKDRFVGDSLSHHTIGGHVFGMPLGSVSTTGVFYNKTMFDELGLSIENGYTYEDLKEICQVIKEKKGITPIIHNGASWWWWPSWFFFTYAQESGNKSEAEIEKWLRGERSFVEDDVIAAFDDIQMFFKDGLISTDSLETDDEAMVANFLQKNAAMFFGSATTYVKFEGADFEIGYVTYPTIVEGAIPQSSGGADEALNILTLGNPENLDVCAAFLEYMTRPEVAQNVFAPVENFGYSTVGVDGFKTEVSDAAFELFTDYTIMYLDWYWAAEHNDAVVAAIQGLTTGQYDGKSAAQYVQDAYDATVSQNDYLYDWWDTWTEDEWAAVAPSYIPVISVD